MTLVGHDLGHRVPVPATRAAGALVSLLGIAVLALGADSTVTVLGIALLAWTGAAWGLYTAAGRTPADPRVATTGHFVLLAAVAALPTAGGVRGRPARHPAGLAWAVVLGAGTTAFGYVAWYACQRSLTATGAGSVQLVIPVVTTVGAVLLLGERLSPWLVVAAGLVGAGSWLGRSR